MTLVAISGCGCSVDANGLVLALCTDHGAESSMHEHRVRCCLDAELDDRVRVLAGRSPTRIERKVGATGTFAIARPAP